MVNETIVSVRLRPLKGTKKRISMKNCPLSEHWGLSLERGRGGSDGGEEREAEKLREGKKEGRNMVKREEGMKEGILL